MTVLLTGGTGFIGINIAEELTKAGYDVVLLDMNELPGEAKESLDKHEGDYYYFKSNILDGDKLDEVIKKFNVSKVIHAAVITPGEKREKEQSKLIAQVNYMGTVEVLEAAKRNKIKKIVHLSSASVYGDASPEADWLSEAKTFPKPKELYAITKFAAECTALRYKELFDLDVVVGRIGGVFGPWERYTGFRDTLSGPFFTTRAAILGEEVVLPNAGVKDWVYSREIAKSIVALLVAKEHAYNIYHLSSGYIWTIKDWCEKLKEVFPDFNYKVLTDPGEIERSPLLIERLKNDIGYKPEFNLKKSFEDYMNWVKNTSNFWMND